MFRSVQERVEQVMAGSPIICIIPDGWDDAHGNHIVNVIELADGIPFFRGQHNGAFTVQARPARAPRRRQSRSTVVRRPPRGAPAPQDVSQTAQFLFKELKKSLDHPKAGVILSDNPSVMQSLKRHARR
jgi:hypothetical protein